MEIREEIIEEKVVDGKPSVLIREEHYACKADADHPSIKPLRTNLVSKVVSDFKEKVVVAAPTTVLPVVEPTVKKLEEDEILALNKKEQIDLIKKLGGDDVKIPHYESERCELILKLQEE